MGDNNRLVAVNTTDGKQWSHTTLFLLVALGLAPFDSTTREGSRLEARECNITNGCCFIRGSWLL